MKTSLGWLLGCSLVTACSVSPVDYGFDSSGTSPKPDAGAGDVTAKSACIPIGQKAPSTDPLAYPACACAKGGAARCVPSAEIPSSLASQLDTCTGGACVPDAIIERGGAAPPTCESAFGEGRCVSLCVPAVADKVTVLDRGKGDVCAADERCVPCKNPLANGESTGVCEIGASAPAETCEDSSSQKAPHTPSSEGGTCAAPASCRSVNDSEGRCLPLSLPMVAEQKELLPESTCGADARCTPCFHPLTGQASGACSTVSCDAPKEPAKTLTACCKSHGRCVPSDAVPASAREELDDDDGTCASQQLCVPEELLPGAKAPAPCKVTFPFVGTYQGVCVSDCFDTFVPSGNCPGDLVCAPNQ